MRLAFAPDTYMRPATRPLAATIALAVMAILSLAGSASAQLFAGSTPTRICEGGSNDGGACTGDGDCEGGVCGEDLLIEEFQPTLDNPDIYVLSHRFRDTTNGTTMFAFFDLEGLNFASGRAQRTSRIPTTSSEQEPTAIQALFEWVTGPPEKIKQRSAQNNVKGKTYTSVRLVFTAIVDARPQIPEQQAIELYAYGNCEEAVRDEDEQCEEDDQLLFPLETEDCDGRTKVNASEDATPEVDLAQVELSAKWRLDCKNLPIPDTNDICPFFVTVGFCEGGSAEGESCDNNADCPDGGECAFQLEEACTPDDLVSAQDLLEEFEGDRDSVTARGNGEADYCDDFVDTDPPDDCEESGDDDDDDS